MRRSRWLLLAAIVCILVSVGATYFKRKEILASDAPPPPARLETGVDTRANDWVWVKSDGTRPVVEVRAKSIRQIKEPSLMELSQIELRLYHKDGSEFDLVKSDKAQFDMPAKALYSDSNVEITMGVPAGGLPRGRVLKIHSSGVRFESDTGKAATDHEARFEFDQGSGSALGADYDPNTRELHLRGQVILDWRGKTADSVPMHIEAGEAFYRERESKVILLPWSKLTRDTLRLEAGMSEVLLEDGEIRHADVQTGHGVQDDPDRRVEFAADQLKMEFTGGMLVSKIAGDRNAKLKSTAAGTETTVTADRLDLDFEASGKASSLSSAIATGKSVAEAQPLPKPGSDLSDTRILKSDVIRLKMRAGGKEIESVETDGPGTLDFLPNSAGQPKRFLKGDRIWIAYGAENRIQSFRSINVATRTDKTAPQGQPAPPPILTQSKEIVATFDPKTSELARLEQKTDFRYDEGVRHARADRATLEQQKDLMTLEGSARVSDPTGSAAADSIVMNQKTGDFTAEGHVASMRLPDQKGKSPAMLSNDEALQARAQRMVSTENNQKIHYEGDAVAWQGANRVAADRLDIDRGRQVLEAHGKVVSQFVDKSAKPSTSPVFTVVRAPDMVYTDETRLAHYTGGVTLGRPGLNVAGNEIRAFLKEAGQDSSLDKTFADGAVRIVSTPADRGSAKRTRIGTSEHAEYYADEQKVFLEGGNPLLIDSLKGQTRGQRLTWWANNDRLLVNGVESKPADTIIRKK
jgi:lipopolysaccharide export system protein LptA